ncbi:MAG: polymer-forming cytoskeletal protein [Bacilli bacterium]|nr:polymer-forming cytoskeletal protein [Bacilli bacterium]MBR2997477.1 polymer-forming cytoskeletal protein [Bacilli bacterium]
MKKSFKILLVLFMFLAFPVMADDGKLYQAGDNVTSESEIAGTSFFAGNNVNTKGTIDGILFSAGNMVLDSSSSDYAFVAGNEVTISGASFKDGFIAGNILKIESSNIERDLYAAASSITLNSNIGRNTYLAAAEVTVNGTINGNLTVYADTINIDSDTVITGTLKYPEDAKITISENAQINAKETVKGNTKDLVKIDIKTKITDMLFSYVNALLVAIVIIAVLGNLYEKIAKMGKDKILSNIGFGLLAMIFIPFVSIILMVTMAGISLGLLVMNLYILGFCLSTIFSSFYYGNLLFKDKIKNKYLLVLVTLLIIYVLRLVPFVGGLVTLLCMCTGFGIIVSLIRRK